MPDRLPTYCIAYRIFPLEIYNVKTLLITNEISLHERQPALYALIETKLLEILFEFDFSDFIKMEATLRL